MENRPLCVNPLCTGRHNMSTDLSGRSVSHFETPMEKERETPHLDWLDVDYDLSTLFGKENDII